MLQHNTTGSTKSTFLTIKNGGGPQVLEVGVQHCVDGRQTLLSGEILPRSRTSQIKPNTITVPWLKTFVVHAKLNARNRQLRKLYNNYNSNTLVCMVNEYEAYTVSWRFIVKKVSK